MPRGNSLLNIRLTLRRHATESPSHAERMVIVDRNSPLEVIAREERVRPKAYAAHLPHGIRLAHALADAPINNAVVELIERKFQMPGRIRPEFIGQAHAPVHMHPLEMNWVD